jgi:hypothetical protein
MISSAASSIARWLRHECAERLDRPEVRHEHEYARAAMEVKNSIVSWLRCSAIAVAPTPRRRAETERDGSAPRDVKYASANAPERGGSQPAAVHQARVAIT